MHRLAITLLLAPSPPAQQVPQPVARALAVLEEARSLSLQGGERIWPGFELAAIPIALYTQDEAFLVHHPAPPAGFTAVSADSVSTAVLRGPRTEAMNANTSGVLGDAIAAFVSIDSLGSGPIDALQVALVVHEAAHAFRDRAPRGGAPRWPAESAALVSSYPIDSPENNAWGQVEGALLAAALECADEVELRALLGDFSVVREHRQSLLGEEMAVFERRLELNEGLAEYFARRAVALAGEPYEVTAPARAAGLDPEGYGTHGRLLAGLRADLRRINRNGWGAARQRFYLTGAAQGLLLDRVDPTWKARLEREQATLQGLLADAVSADRTEGHLERLAATRDYPRLLAHEQAAARAAAALRRRRLGEMLATSGAKLALDLTRAGGAGQVRAFDPMNLIVVEHDLHLHTRMLSLDFDGGQARFDRPVVQDLARGLVLTTLPDGVVMDLDPNSGSVSLSGEGIELECGRASWAEEPELFLLCPGAAGEVPDIAAVEAYLASAIAATEQPLPAPPFELADLSGEIHRQPEQASRRTALVFFSAASWARPAHTFVRGLLAELRPEEYAQDGVRLLLVAAQCDLATLEAFLGPAPGHHVIHDPDRELTLRYGVEAYPTVVWIDPRGTIESFQAGAVGLDALIARLR